MTHPVYTYAASIVAAHLTVLTVVAVCVGLAL